MSLAHYSHDERMIEGFDRVMIGDPPSIIYA
jgi:hypothetical protein